MSGVTVLASSYRRAPSTPDARGVCKALRECASCRDFPIKKERSPHLWRGDRSNLVADELPAGRHFCEHEVAMELAGGGFPALLLLNRGPNDRDRYIAVNPNFMSGSISMVSRLVAPRWASALGTRDESFKKLAAAMPDSAPVDGTSKQRR